MFWNGDITRARVKHQIVLSLQLAYRHLVGHGVARIPDIVLEAALERALHRGRTGFRTGFRQNDLQFCAFDQRLRHEEEDAVSVDIDVLLIACDVFVGIDGVGGIFVRQVI